MAVKVELDNIIDAVIRYGIRYPKTSLIAEGPSDATIEKHFSSMQEEMLLAFNFILEFIRKRKAYYKAFQKYEKEVGMVPAKSADFIERQSGGFYKWVARIGLYINHLFLPAPPKIGSEEFDEAVCDVVNIMTDLLLNEASPFAKSLGFDKKGMSHAKKENRIITSALIAYLGEKYGNEQKVAKNFKDNLIKGLIVYRHPFGCSESVKPEVKAGFSEALQKNTLRDFKKDRVKPFWQDMTKEARHIYNCRYSVNNRIGKALEDALIEV